MEKAGKSSSKKAVLSPAIEQQIRKDVHDPGKFNGRSITWFAGETFWEKLCNYLGSLGEAYANKVRDRFFDEMKNKVNDAKLGMVRQYELDSLAKTQIEEIESVLEKDMSRDRKSELIQLVIDKAESDWNATQARRVFRSEKEKLQNSFNGLSLKENRDLKNIQAGFDILKSHSTMIEKGRTNEATRQLAITNGVATLVDNFNIIKEAINTLSPEEKTLILNTNKDLFARLEKEKVAYDLLREVSKARMELAGGGGIEFKTGPKLDALKGAVKKAKANPKAHADLKFLSAKTDRSDVAGTYNLDLA